MKTIAEVESIYNDWHSQSELLKEQISKKHAQIDAKQLRYENILKARWVLTEVVKLTQIRFKEKVEKLITKCIQSVYDRPFKFILDFQRIRNKIECYPKIEENGNVYDDIEYMHGGGLCDIISFSFRVVLWSLTKPRLRNVLILDEPFKFLGDYKKKAAQMLKEISHNLKIQIIMITHDEEFSEIADKAWRVTQNKGISMVEEIN